MPLDEATDRMLTASITVTINLAHPSKRCCKHRNDTAASGITAACELTQPQECCCRHHYIPCLTTQNVALVMSISGAVMS